MAIAPIDLQTLFTQMDKVAKTHTLQKEGQAMHEAVQGTQIQKKNDEQILQVSEAQNTGDGANKIDDNGKNSGGEENKRERERKEKEKEEEAASVLSDLSLGRKIDISL